MPDKYKALWVSFSSISDFLKCPRAYFLKNIYKNPATGRKIEITQPALSLGSAVHKVLEPLSLLPAEKRFESDLEKAFLSVFDTYKGKRGGFSNDREFELNKDLGIEMIKNVISHPEPLMKETFHSSQDLLSGWLSVEEEIIICGKIDWVNALSDKTLEVLDFKTSKKAESNDLQLQIYAILLLLLNKSPINSLNYWYLRLNEFPTNVDLPNIKDSKDRVLELAERIKLSKENNLLSCPRGGCWECEDFETIREGGAEMVGLGEYKREIYYIES